MADSRRRVPRAKHLTGFPRELRQMIATLGNQYGCDVRMIDGRHVLVYDGDRTSRPLKISAMSGRGATIRVREWAAERGIEL